MLTTAQQVVLSNSKTTLYACVFANGNDSKQYAASNNGVPLLASATSASTTSSTITPAFAVTSITLSQGASSTINSSVISVTPASLASSTALTYVLTTAPTAGSITKSGTAQTAGAIFAASDVTGGLVSYVHNNSDVSSTATDSFKLTPVYSGKDQTAITISVTIRSSCYAGSGQTSHLAIANPALTNGYIICTAAQLNSLGATTADYDKNYNLRADIDLSAYTGTSFNRIGSLATPFTGTFNGEGHTIANFTYTNAAQN